MSRLIKLVGDLGRKLEAVDQRLERIESILVPGHNNAAGSTRGLPIEVPQHLSVELAENGPHGFNVNNFHDVLQDLSVELAEHGIVDMHGLNNFQDDDDDDSDNNGNTDEGDNSNDGDDNGDDEYDEY